MDYRFLEDLDYERYDAFARSHELGNLLQSAPWPEVKSGWRSQRVGLEDQSGRLSAAALILRRPVLPGLYFAYVPHGPLLDYQDAEVLDRFLSELQMLAKRERWLVLRLHPPVPIHEDSIKAFREGTAREAYSLELLNQRFSARGFQLQPRGLRMADTIQPRFQAELRRSTWEEPPRGKIRHQLKLCERYHVEIERFTGDEALLKLDDFEALIRMTEKRQGIQLRDKEYFARLIRSYGDDAALFFADFDLERSRSLALEREEALREELELCRESSPRKARQLEEQLVSVGKDLEFYQSLEDEGVSDRRHPSAVLALRYGRAAEMPYAGSDESFSRLPAVWALYVEGARWAFAGGAGSYNLGGLEGDLADGLSVFKSHFDPLIVETAGEYDYSPRRILYPLFLKALRLRKECAERA